MGRPPSSGGGAFRFTQSEVVEMEACLQEANNAIPAREIISSLAEKFSVSAERVGKITVQPKQVWNWFQNRRYAQRMKLRLSPGKPSVSPPPRDDPVPGRIASQSLPTAPGRNFENPQMEFEAKSARDGAWYDVSAFISHRMFETGDPEVRVRFTGFGIEEDEWINVRKCVRQRSLPCEASECVAVLPGDLILCFQEGKEQALYFDAHVLDTQRRRHDVRGCRCRFLVRYDHDHSEEIVPLRKVCRRPETDYRLHILHASKTSGSADPRNAGNGSSQVTHAQDFGSGTQKPQKQRRLDEGSSDGTITTPPAAQPNEPGSAETTATPTTTPTAETSKVEDNSVGTSDFQAGDAGDGGPQEGNNAGV
ncbi:hypothetical protein QJS10_CPB11g00019 [Acorus calamus]|uniref:Homeobox domain-containing protein n=1 Tax=Acorus calamus TaxID=4465 RepID=A0AAV9DT99_ACOCL|nr:hypothetical protein QJS10_CPB11g00019 [Acorus calamus]